ncbi:MAG: sugar phosphate nucleotidyltransferase, partial [Chloroflexota bacterium]|nr:sugar phosphate nucleotidyltransferase [Chloroflexota bacterium]
MKIVLPMAGFGTRLRPHTWSVPKPLVPLAGKTMIDHIFDRLLPLDPEEIICIVGYLGDQIEAYLRERYSVPLRFVVQPEMRGQAHAIALTRGLVDGPSLIMFADTIFEADFSPLHGLRDEGADGAIYVKEIADPRRFGIAVIDAEGYATQLVEKPENPVSNLALVGIYYFAETGALYEAIDTLIASGKMLKGEYFLADAVQVLIDRGQRLKTFTIPVWEDCGKPEELLQTNRYLLGQLNPAPRDYTDSIVIPPSFVDPTATLTRSVVGPHASIGAGAKLDGVVIANSVVG